MDPLLPYQIALTLIPGVGDVNAKKLVSYCGGVEAVFREKKRALMKIPGIGKIMAGAVTENNVLKRAEEEILFIEKFGITPLFYLDKAYPARLKHCADNPVMLYYKGKADLNPERVVSIVGTRSATEYGKGITKKLVEGLSETGAMIISGLAYGIDATSHKAALKHELPTVGVMAHGLDRVYPATHRSLAEKMLENGGLITEFLKGTKPDRENFPQRNRIIAGLADAVVVVEAAKKGGALITAEIANSYNRDVFAIPGRVGDTYSEGCNYSIKSNRAALLENTGDLLYMMGWNTDFSRKKETQKKLFVELSKEEEIIYSLLSEAGEVSVDWLCEHAGITPGKIASVLLNLEFSGLIKSLPGKMYKIY